MGILDRLRQKGGYASPADEARFHYQKGEEAHQRSKYGEAEREFKKAIELDPNSSDAREGLESTYMSLALEKRWETDRLVGLLKECARLNPNTVAHALLGRIYDLQERPDEANQEYKEHLRIYPDWEDMLAVVGGRSLSGMRSAAADEMARRMLGIHREPWEPSPFRSWSEIRKSLGR